VHLSMLLDMASDGMSDRIGFGDRVSGTTYGEFRNRVRSAATRLLDTPGDRVCFLGLNSVELPVALFAAGLAGKAFAPLNYRLTDARLGAALRRLTPATLVLDHEMQSRVSALDGLVQIDTSGLEGREPTNEFPVADAESAAILLLTSGTTGEPKAAVLRHSNLTSYILGTVEFASAGPDEAALVSVPPYHIAGMSAVLSNLYAGRRTFYLDAFDPLRWVRTVEDQGITHAMVVPTMLDRILQAKEQTGAKLSTLRAVSYGGGPMPVDVVIRALEQLPHTDFVNAYGLTETSSTIAVLGPAP
jgi:fatty-acyl-CoA synthase